MEVAAAVLCRAVHQLLHTTDRPESRCISQACAAHPALLHHTAELSIRGTRETAAAAAAAAAQWRDQLCGTTAVRHTMPAAPDLCCCCTPQPADPPPLLHCTP
ncbi:hypothetical protein E2C01_086779 [Portunus trituberculatus]|uniref:Uncharacterized protein n=1 Tax=Portunus trituberculatus TaxID=210409 RepID=A0A5B7JBG1_PORTR|nr:hypothetical protein [Portunus trituberculatus]